MVVGPIHTGGIGRKTKRSGRIERQRDSETVTSKEEQS